MKKLVSLSIAVFFTVAAFSQQTPNADKKQDMKDLRKDIKDVRSDKRDRKQDIRTGHYGDARRDTKDIRADKRDIRSDRRDLKEDGVKHPVRRADRQIKTGRR
jgi:hypothetical protein